MSVQTEITRIQNEVNTQTDLIERISTALANKAAGGGTDTSDATATSNDILKDKTAYVSGEKITGTIETFDGSYECSGDSTGGASVEAWTGTLNIYTPLGGVSTTLYYTDETLTPSCLAGADLRDDAQITIAAGTALFFSACLDLYITNAEDITNEQDVYNYNCIVIRPTSNNFSIST